MAPVSGACVMGISLCRPNKNKNKNKKLKNKMSIDGRSAPDLTTAVLSQG